MIGEIVEENGVKQIRTLSGGMSDGLPLGTIIAIHSPRLPIGFLPCNGAVFDIHQYPSLYTLLGKNTLPDLRECALVGIGLSDRPEISAHDVYLMGQFKDDQVQTIGSTLDTSGIEITVTDPGHTHTATVNRNDVNVPAGSNYNGTGAALFKGAVRNNDVAATTNTQVTVESATTGITAAITSGSVTATFDDYRHGAVTHGKSYGINYAIKATTGSVDVDDAQIYADVVAFITENYTQVDKTSIEDNNLLKYDSTTDKLVPIPNSTVNGRVLSYKSATTSHTYHPIYTDGTNFYNASLATTVEPEGTAGTSTSLGQTTKYNDEYYVKDTDWYKVLGLTPTGYTLDSTAVTDTDVIDALEASTDFVTFQYVIYDETVTTEAGYEWTRNGGTTTHVFNTQAEYALALTIPEGSDGFIQNGDVIVKNWVTDKLRGVDNNA